VIRMHAVVGAALLATALAVASPSASQTAQQPRSMGQIEGVQPWTGAATTIVLRQVNSLQAFAAQADGTFMEITRVIQSGLPYVNGEPWWQVDPHSARSGPVTLRLMVAEDGKTYSVTAHEEDRCSTSAFSDERGVVYEGRALGCDSER
jgi:hypothetical protein